MNAPRSRPRIPPDLADYFEAWINGNSEAEIRESVDDVLASLRPGAEAIAEAKIQAWRDADFKRRHLKRMDGAGPEPKG